MDAEVGAGGGIFALRRTSAKSSGKVVQVPERRRSSARARTRSGQPVEAREVVSVSWSLEIVLSRVDVVVSESLLELVGRVWMLMPGEKAFARVL